jgi:chromosome segregation ATPase
VLASDGVENSFAAPALSDGFLKGLLVDMACGNIDGDSDGLDRILSNLSQTGSGDDMSLAALYDSVAVSQASSLIAADRERQEAEQRARELSDKRVSMERKHEYLKERSAEAECVLRQQQASLDELREAIQKRREGEEQLGRSIDELQRERECREHEYWKSGFGFDLKRLFASPRQRQRYDALDTESAREIASLGAGIVRAKKAREEIRHARMELEDKLAHCEQEFDGDAEQAVQDFKEYDARYRALENEIARLESMIDAGGE